ncbi:MAG TPA: GNAT family N-acetyltransferase [Anaerolineae bacterium]|nr:GNAT family N-acetyltransferase [Anaerolineae bacterium]
MSIHDQLVIRPIRPEDAEDQYATVTDPRVTANLIQLPSMEFSQTEEWIEKAKPGVHRLVADLNGRSIGSINIRQFQHPRMHHAGSIGLMVNPEFWGQGVGSALMTAVLNLADNWLNLFRVELTVYTHNKVAIHLYEKFGFAPEGVQRKLVFGNGRYFDAFVMARLRYQDTYPTSSPPPSAPPRRSPAQVLLRPPRYPDDREDIYQLYLHPAVARTTLRSPSQEPDFVDERFKKAGPGIYRYVAVVDEKVVGIGTLHQSQNLRTRHSAGLGMMVHPNYWGMGIGTQIMEKLLDLADNWLNLVRVDLEVNTDNPTAVHLYEKFGFVIEGTKKMHAFGDGRMADSYFMARIQEQA